MKFKATFLFSLLLLLFFNHSCRTVDQLTQFNMDFNETITIPSATGINLPINILTPDVETNSESTFEINDTRKDLIEHISLTSLTISLSAPENADFSFLESINVYMNAPDLPEVEIAWANSIPENVGGVLMLDVSGADFQEYIKKDQFSLRLNTITDELLTADHQLEIATTFFIDAKILGL